MSSLLGSFDIISRDKNTVFDLFQFCLIEHAVDHEYVKSVNFGHVHSQHFAPVNAHVYEKALPLLCLPNSTFCAIISFHGELIFPTNVFHENMRITDALKKNAHDQNEQTIKMSKYAVFDMKLWLKKRTFA